MAAPVGVTYVTIFELNLTLRMAAQTKVPKNYNILFNFDHPDGSTSWGYMLLYFS